MLPLKKFSAPWWEITEEKAGNPISMAFIMMWY
jgi:hypothetical protein